MHSSNPWLSLPRPVPDGRLRLFCLPYAGGSASVYRTWAALLPAGVELCAVQLPGREGRFREPLQRNLMTLVRAMAQAIRPALDRPFALFGHSMGSLLSFELAHHLRSAYELEPERLFISARRAPHLAADVPPIHALPTPMLLDELRRMNGTPEAVLNDLELMDLLLPIIRADFCMLETYTFTPRAPLGISVTAFAADRDTEVTPDEVRAWRAHTSGPFHFHLLPGDHFFLNSQRPELLRLLSLELAWILNSLDEAPHR
jgi:medium-chain acyl-[acyl-carrier-protein] hydrolase